MGFSHGGEAGLVVGILLAYVILLFGVIRRYASSLAHEKVPMTLPRVSLVWFLASMVAFMVWNARSDPRPANVTARSWFSGGWADNFYLFNIRIDTWWKYTVIVIYQMTRSVIGSLLSNIFKPFMVTEVQSKLLNNQTDIKCRNDILFSQFAVTLFTYFSNITDLFLYLAQIDVSLVSLGVTLLSDGGSTFLMLEYGLLHPEKVAVKPSGFAAANDASAAPYNRLGDWPPHDCGTLSQRPSGAAKAAFKELYV